MRVSVSQLRVISHRYSKESQSSSPVGEPRVYRTGVMGSRDPSQSVGPSNTSPLAVPEAELITTLPSKKRFHALSPTLRCRRGHNRKREAKGSEGRKRGPRSRTRLRRLE
jgi:hypothetical protein